MAHSQLKDNKDTISCADAQCYYDKVVSFVTLSIAIGCKPLSTRGEILLFRLYINEFSFSNTIARFNVIKFE